jgi:hypothetical protein
MATTGSNLVRVTTTTLKGATVTTAPYLLALGPKEAAQVQQGGGGTVLDRVTVDLSLLAAPAVGTPQQVPVNYGAHIGNFAKNGAILLTLSGTTAQDVDLTDLTANTPAGTVGDTAFATVSVLVFRNLGSAAATVKPGASNPADIPKFTGTTPTLQIPAGGTVIVHANTPVTIDATHKLFTITPAADGTVAISVGGA